MTLENSILPSTELQGSAATAGTYPGGQALSGRPAIARSAGATKTWKETRALTGLPGRVKTGTRSSPRTPKPWGMPGRIATLSNCMVPTGRAPP